MAKRTTSLPLTLPTRAGGAPAYRWLYEAVRSAILEGRLRPGARLPGTRDLGQQYGLSRGTIVTAFDQLHSEGYVEGRVGSGTYVSAVLPEERLHVPRIATTPSHAPRRPRRLSRNARGVTQFGGFEVRRTRAFRSDLPALDLFPIALWARITARRLKRASVNLLLGCAPTGYRPLQQALADYLARSRGVKCTPEQVVVVAGVQEALDVAARLFLEPGDRVCMEDPGYRGAAFTFEAVGAKVVPVGLDAEGLRANDRRLRGARLIYVTPGHQFPLGITMSLRRRLELLEVAHRSGALVFEDDYDSEFRYLGRPVPALQGLDRHGCVLFAGSLNKVLFPSLRLGYLVVPPDLVDHVAALRSVTVRHPPLLEQAVLCDFITDGHFGRHLRRMREVYAERLAVLLESAKVRLAGLLEISPVEAGLQTAGFLRAGLNGETAARAAAARDVEVSPLSRFTRGRPGREGLQLGFAAVDTTEIRRGVRDLASALEGL